MVLASLLVITIILINLYIMGSNKSNSQNKEIKTIQEAYNYTEDKIKELEGNKDIIRNKLKIKASIKNTKIFKKIQLEYGSFANYLKSFTKDKTVYENDKTHSDLSDAISKDLQKKGMSFVGTTIIYSYLQAIGVIYSHETECFMYKE